MNQIARQETGTEGWQRRTHFDASAADQFGLDRALEVWRMAADTLDRHFPNISRVDVTADNPFGFTWIRHNGGQIGMRPGGSTCLTGSVLGDHESRLVRMDTAADYELAKMIGQPLVSRIEQSIWGVDRDYARIILPVFRGGKVAELAYLVTPLQRVPLRECA